MERRLSADKGEMRTYMADVYFVTMEKIFLQTRTETDGTRIWMADHFDGPHFSFAVAELAPTRGLREGGGTLMGAARNACGNEQA